MDNLCDYCYGEMEKEGSFLIPVGFYSIGEVPRRLPLVKTWCGDCGQPQDADPEAYAALQELLKK